MFPITDELVRAIQDDYIRAAMSTRPAWRDHVRPTGRSEEWLDRRQRARRRLATVLRRLAAAIDDRGSHTLRDASTGSID
jgi:hypothetical protein